MTRKETDSPPVPELTLSPPAGEVLTIPEPQAPEPAESGAPKRKRNRRTKAELEKARQKEEAAAKAAGGTPEGQASPEELQRCAVALTAMFEIGGKILAKRRGPHWRLDTEECQSLAQAWTNALAPWLPKIGAAMPFAAALAITFGVVKPRLDQDAKLQEETPGSPALVVP